jgi:hypothetical protein
MSRMYYELTDLEEILFKNKMKSLRRHDEDEDYRLDYADSEIAYNYALNGGEVNDNDEDRRYVIYED